MSASPGDPSAAPHPAGTAPGRLLSLDAYRGLTMLAMATHELGVAEVADRFPQSRVWQFWAYQFSHVEWVGCAAWDLIQPSFMFMVGVAMPFSLANRASQGQSLPLRSWHVLQRSLVLVALGVGLYSLGRPQINYTFVNVLAQIGLAYPFLYLCALGSTRQSWFAAALIAVGYWLWFALYPLPPANFDYSRFELPAEWPHLTGFFAHWDKHTNAAAAFDRWFLNLFPRPEPFVINGGGYQTLNFVPSLINMLAGLQVGRLLLSPLSATTKLVRLLAWAAVGLLVGWLLGQTACPMVKRIWTPSWAIFSTGWTLALLAACYGLIDLAGWRRWAWPAAVVGMNSIAMYLMAETLPGFIVDLGKTVSGHDPFTGTYGPIQQSLAVVLVLWLVCYWLYRRKIFIRI